MGSTNVGSASQLLNELRERVSVLTYPERTVVKQELGFLAYLVAKFDDPLCALCSHLESEHAHDGLWCPMPLRTVECKHGIGTSYSEFCFDCDDQMWNYSQKFVADLQSLRKGA